MQEPDSSRTTVVLLDVKTKVTVPRGAHAEVRPVRETISGFASEVRPNEGRLCRIGQKIQVGRTPAAHPPLRVPNQ